MRGRALVAGAGRAPERGLRTVTSSCSTVQTAPARSSGLGARGGISPRWRSRSLAPRYSCARSQDFVLGSTAQVVGATTAYLEQLTPVYEALGAEPARVPRLSASGPGRPASAADQIAPSWIRKPGSQGWPRAVPRMRARARGAPRSRRARPSRRSHGGGGEITSPRLRAAQAGLRTGRVENSSGGAGKSSIAMTRDSGTRANSCAPAAGGPGELSGRTLALLFVARPEVLMAAARSPAHWTAGEDGRDLEAHEG
jgi:hypothetical protein